MIIANISGQQIMTDGLKCPAAYICKYSFTETQTSSFIYVLFMALLM